MTREKIFLTALTYPLPSSSYEELLCTAGFREDGSMIRLYPVPFSRYNDLHKYTFIELSIKKRNKGDFRPESFSPVNFDLRDMIVHGKVNTDDNWNRRKELCLNNIYTDFDNLISDSRDPGNKSLAVFKPKEIIDLIIEVDERDWKSVWKAGMNQFKIFGDSDKKIKLDKIPYKFKYHFKDSKNKTHKLQILDWEIGALYRNCLKSSGGNEKEALKLVKEKYFNKFRKLDIHFFLGTTFEWHLRRAKNPFVIIGVFYPPYSNPSIPF